METMILLAIILVASWWYKANKATIKGKVGEIQVASILHTLDPNDYILLNDLYLPKKDGKTTQIDHVLIAPNGIFVIETKNYKGWISGSEHNQYWTQTNYKRKDKLYNPIWQNSGHIKALQAALTDSLKEVPIHSVIVFGNQATLKFKQPFKNADMVHTSQLLSVIRSKNSSEGLNHFTRQKINHLLSRFILKDRKAQKEQSKHHIEAIKTDKNTRNQQIANNICPRCGGQLVVRTGKNGKFKGCSSFPKCRFIA